MRIGIVGFGIGGATAAATLTRRGCDVTVFEQAAEIREVGAGVATWPSTIRCHIRMGLGEALAAVGVPARNWVLKDPDGTILQQRATAVSDGTPCYTFHRAELLRAIATLVPPDRIHLCRRVNGAHEFDDRVDLRFDNGSIESFDMVLGADGIRSVVQAGVVPASPPKAANLVAYRGLVKNGPEINMQSGCLWTDRTKYMVAFPVSAGRLVNFVGVVPAGGLPEESWFAEGKKSDLAAEFEGWDATCQRIIQAVTSTFRWGLYYRDPLPTIVSRRIGLLGDAAHPMLIHAGQGVGQAMEDAFALGILLEGATAEQAPERLRLYERARLPRATYIQNQSRRNAQLLHSSFPLEPGEERPKVSSDNTPFLDFDVEGEVAKFLASAQ